MLTSQDTKDLKDLNAVFNKIEAIADEMGLTPDEMVTQHRNVGLGGIGTLEKEIPTFGAGRAELFAKTSTPSEAFDEKKKF